MHFLVAGITAGWRLRTVAANARRAPNIEGFRDDDYIDVSSFYISNRRTV